MLTDPLPQEVLSDIRHTYKELQLHVQAVERFLDENNDTLEEHRLISRANAYLSIIAEQALFVCSLINEARKSQPAIPGLDQPSFRDGHTAVEVAYEVLTKEDLDSFIDLEAFSKRDHR